MFLVIPTITINSKELEESLSEANRVLEPGEVIRHLTTLAEFVLSKSINAPIPKDTGALSRSGQVDEIERQKGPEDKQKGGVARVRFGFNIVYAGVQDLGFRDGRMPPKPYGTHKGPNRYFTQTLTLLGPNITKVLALLIKADFDQIERRAKKAKGKNKGVNPKP